jgi:NAD(P)-dependent dehydrogenase (short-subunit alcohol dehydrogenase family)
MFHSTGQALAASLDLSGATVIVTGGSKGIGRGIAARFLEAGADVVICARHAPAEPVTHGGKEAVFVEADVREVEHIDRVIAVAKDRFGKLDVLVNNAGGTPFALAANASPRYSASIIALNLTAPLVFATRANALMQTQESSPSSGRPRCA